MEGGEEGRPGWSAITGCSLGVLRSVTYGYGVHYLCHVLMPLLPHLFSSPKSLFVLVGEVNAHKYRRREQVL